jgi:hypothetical protein
MTKIALKYIRIIGSGFLTGFVFEVLFMGPL